MVGAYERKRVAVVGGGAAGITASHLLSRVHDVTLFDSDDLGGHAHSVAVDNGREESFEVDTAFLIFNTKTYPLFYRLLDELGVRSRAADSAMSMTFFDRSRNLYFANRAGLRGLFAQPRNAARPAFWALIAEIARFKRDAESWLEKKEGLEEPLGEYLRRRGYSNRLARNFVYPLVAAVWSVSKDEPQRFPALSLMRYLAWHAVLKRRGARWQTLRGGSGHYVRAFARAFRGRLRLREPVECIRRGSDRVQVVTREGATDFDHVVLATHADQALRMLEQPTADERRLLGAWSYSSSTTVLHTDDKVLGTPRRVWSSWNLSFDSRKRSAVANTITYHLNRVQAPPTSTDYFITLGDAPIREKEIVGSFVYRHPVMNVAAQRTQKELRQLNDRERVSFCGSYFGHGFHEDAIESAVDAARGLGVEWS